MKTKIFTLLLALTASVGTIFASDTQVDGIWYEFDATTHTASVTYRGSAYTSYSNEYSGSVVIPSYVTYNNVKYSVTSIGYEAFSECRSLTSVTIPNTVTWIGTYAFWLCTGLTSIKIPNSVTSIGDVAFQFCSGLTYIICEAEDPPLATNAFDDIIKKIPLYVPADRRSAYREEYGWEKFNSIQAIPLTINGIGYCLDSFDQIAQVIAPLDKKYSGDIVIPSVVTYKDASYRVTSIGDKAFMDCTSLTSIKIPNSVTSIGEYAFASCTGLTSVTIPNSVTSIGIYAFQYCSGLTSVTMSNSVASIGDFAFAWCDVLTSIEIPNSVASIGEYAFVACIGLTSVTIPNSVISIGEYAFGDCTSLTSIICKSKNPPAMGKRVFNQVAKSKITLFVPEESRRAYHVADQWDAITNIKAIQ